MKAEPKPRRPIDPYEAQCFKDLAMCTFLPGSPDKRFVRNMQGASEITEGQAEYLQRLVYRYRRQQHLTDQHAKVRVEKLKLVAGRREREHERQTQGNLA